MRILFVLVFTLVSCNSKNNKMDNSDIFVPHGETAGRISFKQVQKEVFIPKCISCHGRAGGINLETYQATKGHLESIKRATLQTKSMPKAPVSALNRRQMELLTAWCDAGGPEHSRNDDPSEEGEETESELNFSKIKEEIIDVKCITCHARGEHAGSIPFETREDVLASSLNLVVPGRPDQSRIYTIVKPGARDMMPPYPAEPLSSQQIEMLNSWINKGAP
jgi:uncharacterized membrane protein